MAIPSQVPCTPNGRQCFLSNHLSFLLRVFYIHTGAYLLADGIYPHWAYLMGTIKDPTTEKEKVYARAQEAVRKDVERAFGRLHSKWHILKFPAMARNVEHLKDMWGCCIILHNMTLKDQKTKRLERTEVTVYQPSVEHVELREMRPLRDAAWFARHRVTAIADRREQMEDTGMGSLKQLALIDHVFAHSRKRSAP